MHTLAPFHLWTDMYDVARDPRFRFLLTRDENTHNVVYNYVLHPAWDDFGSSTLYFKMLFADYEKNTCIIEFIGEWNDVLENDIMQLKNMVIDTLLAAGVRFFVCITEHVFIAHTGARDYYDAWVEEVTERGGWIVFMNTMAHNRGAWDGLQARYAHFHLYENTHWRRYEPADLIGAVQRDLGCDLLA